MYYNCNGDSSWSEDLTDDVPGTYLRNGHCSGGCNKSCSYALAMSDDSERYSRWASIPIYSMYVCMYVYMYVQCTWRILYRQPRLVNSDTYSALPSLWTVNYDYDPACRIHGNKHRYLWRGKKTLIIMRIGINCCNILCPRAIRRTHDRTNKSFRSIMVLLDGQFAAFAK